MKLNNLYVLSIIFILAYYHFIIHNNLEKLFMQCHFNYNNIKRPKNKCQDIKKCYEISCIGLPSGHAETSSVLLFLLYFNKYISLWTCLLLIFIVCLQRILADMHTIFQVIIGSLIGLLYAFIYSFNTNHISILGIFTVLSIGITLAYLCVDKYISTTNHQCFDNDVYKNIDNNMTTYSKIMSIYSNIFIIHSQINP